MLVFVVQSFKEQICILWWAHLGPVCQWLQEYLFCSGEQWDMILEHVTWWHVTNITEHSNHLNTWLSSIDPYCAQACQWPVVPFGILCGATEYRTFHSLRSHVARRHGIPIMYPRIRIQDYGMWQRAYWVKSSTFSVQSVSPLGRASDKEVT
jgi:hypothetical protein